MRKIVVIAHDIRSTHNVGALFRTADCMGIDHVYLTGYTPYPIEPNDERLPHLREKINRQIDKTALGACEHIHWSHSFEVRDVLAHLRREGYHTVALEQSSTSTPLQHWSPSDKVAILLGREVEGIDTDLLSLCDEIVEIPQFGYKESLNVVQAAAMALYHARFVPFA